MKADSVDASEALAALATSASAEPERLLADARARAAAGDHAGALEATRAATAAASPQARPRAEVILALALWRAGRVEEAREELDRIIGATPKAPVAWRNIADEMRRRAGEAADRFTSATSMHYADAVYSTSRKYASAPQDSPYFPSWRLVIEKIRAINPRVVLDLGCGPGQFAELLSRSIFGLGYVGVDFSAVALRMARMRAPSYRFVRLDLSQARRLAAVPYGMALALEVLEHLEEDLALIRALRPGVHFVGTVPNFDSFGHVRFFLGPDDVRRRYEAVLLDLTVEEMILGGNTLFLLQGVTKRAGADDGEPRS